MLWQMVRSQARFPIVLATLGSNLLALTLPIVTLQLYDRVIPDHGLASLQVLAAGLACSLILDVLLRVAQTFVGWSAARFEHDAGCIAVRSFLMAKPAAVEKEAPGVHVQRLNAIERLREFAVHQGLVALVDLPFAFIFLGLIWLIAPPLLLVSLVFIVIAFGGACFTGARLRQAVHARSDVDDRRISFLLEVLDAAHTIKGAAIETAILRRYERLLEQAAVAGYRTSFIGGIAQGLGGILGQILGFGIVALGAVLVLDHDLTVGGLAACNLLAGRALQPLLRAVGVFTQFYAVVEAADRLKSVLMLPASRNPAKSVKEPDGAVLSSTECRSAIRPDRRSLPM